MLASRKTAKALESMETAAPIEGRSLWADARIRFFRNKAAVSGLIILVFVGLFAAFGAHLTPWSNEEVARRWLAELAPRLSRTVGRLKDDG